MSENSKITFNGPVETFIDGKVEGDVIRTQNNYSCQQTVANEEKKLLYLIERFEQDKLSDTQTKQKVQTFTDNQPEILDVEIIQQAVTSNPTLRERLIAASKAGFLEALKTAFPPFSIAYEVLKAGLED